MWALHVNSQSHFCCPRTKQKTESFHPSTKHQMRSWYDHANKQDVTSLSQATTTQVLPTPTPAQVIDGPVTRSRAKKLQQEVHALLCEINFNINENYVLSKCSTLIILRYIEEEKDESDPKEQTRACPRTHYQTESQKRTSGSQERTSANKSS